MASSMTFLKGDIPIKLSCFLAKNSLKFSIFSGHFPHFD